MNGKEFLKKITNIDNKIIEDNKNYQNRRFFKKYSVVAACLILITISLIFTLQNNKISKNNPINLPKLTMDLKNYSAMGFGTIKLHNIDELISDNPWNKNIKFTTLPVYKNLYTADGAGLISNPNREKMVNIILDLANKLDMDTDNLDIKDITCENLGIKTLIEITVEDSNTIINVESDFTAHIKFKSPIKIPSNYNCSENASYNELKNLSKYFYKNCNKYTTMDIPNINVVGGQYLNNNYPSYGIKFYNKNSNELENILNYNFNSGYINGLDENKYCIENNEINSITIKNIDKSGYVGDYPIINVEEALKLLENNYYICDNKNIDFPGTDSVKKVTLIYDTSRFSEYYMPLYKFYVQIPNPEIFYGKNDDNLNYFTCFYVPAIESKYIKNMPQRHFN